MTISRKAPSHTNNTVVPEGILTGLLGALVVALFYFLLDVAHGHPLLTPSVLGQALLLHELPTTSVIDVAAVITYTTAHLLAFMLFGLLLATMVRAAERKSLARYAVVQLFIVFEFFFYGVLLLGAASTREMFPLWSVLAANSLAVVAMGLWQWRHHPMLQMASRVAPLARPTRQAISASVRRA